ncbi:putative leader peptide [Microbispora sp. NPDC004025]
MHVYRASWLVRRRHVDLCRLNGSACRS